jgi:hypothetical protein
MSFFCQCNSEDPEEVLAHRPSKAWEYWSRLWWKRQRLKDSLWLGGR